MTEKVQHFQVFETAAGFTAIGWHDDAISSLRLPAKTEREAERALLKRLPSATRATPPDFVARVISDIQRYFAGDVVDFDRVPIDLGEQQPLFSRIYDFVRRLGRGETTTYGTVAKELAVGPEFARDVGQAMATNPVPLIVPCHRVLGAGGKVGGFSAPGGSNTKARMLALEGVPVQDDAPRPKRAEKQVAFGF